MDDAETPAGLRRAQYVATLLDDAITIPGVNVKIGLDALVGLLPISGDLAAAVCSLYIVAEAARSGVAKRTLVHMLFNIAVDVGIGSVPLVGDLFDVFWKANRRNVDLFERAVGAAD